MRDSAKVKGWVDIDESEDIEVSVSGINYLEQDMPKAESQ